MDNAMALALKQQNKLIIKNKIYNSLKIKLINLKSSSKISSTVNQLVINCVKINKENSLHFFPKNFDI